MEQETERLADPILLFSRFVLPRCSPDIYLPIDIVEHCVIPYQISCQMEHDSLSYSRDRDRRKAL